MKASVSRAAKLANAKYEKTTGVVYLGQTPPLPVLSFCCAPSCFSRCFNRDAEGVSAF